MPRVSKPKSSVFHVPWGTRDVLKLFGFIFFTPLVLYILLIALSHFGLVPNGLREAIRSGSSAVDMAFTIVALVVEVIGLAWLCRKYKVNIYALGLKKFSWWRALLWGLLAVAVCISTIAIVFALIAVLVPAIDLNETQEVGFEFGRSGAGLWLSFVVTVVIVPIIEELYFRGVAFSAFGKRFGLVAGIVGSSLLFGVLHFQTNVIIYTFLLGVILCLLYLKTKSIVPGIILHSLNNSVAFLVLVGVIG